MKPQQSKNKQLEKKKILKLTKHNKLSFVTIKVLLFDLFRLPVSHF